MRFKWNCSYKLVVPKGAVSPTGSIYRMFDIIEQGSVLHHVNDSRTMYSAKPFTLRYKLPSGRIQTRKAKLNAKPRRTTSEAC